MKNLNLNYINIDIYRINKIKVLLNKPIFFKNKNKYQNIYFGKNGLALYNNSLIIIDLDIGNIKENINKGLDLINFIPTNTVSVKTPNGYHFYFYNDLGFELQNYVKIDIEGQKYAIDILNNKTKLILCPPTVFDGGSYKWLNSPQDISFLPISKIINSPFLKSIVHNKPYIDESILINSNLEKKVFIFTGWEYHHLIINLIGNNGIKYSVLLNSNEIFCFYNKQKQLFFIFLKKYCLFNNTVIQSTVHQLDIIFHKLIENNEVIVIHLYNQSDTLTSFFKNFNYIENYIKKKFYLKFIYLKLNANNKGQSRIKEIKNKLENCFTIS